MFENVEGRMQESLVYYLLAFVMHMCVTFDCFDT